jgi:two-component system, OmpR family, response regulator QseB
MRLLLVEDDAMIGRSLEKGLRQDGYAVDWVRDGRAAESALAAEDYALVLLDLGLPELDGRSVLSRLRLGKQQVPVLIITARDTVAERVLSLDAGADDYLVKPFSFEELGARIRAVLRRQAGSGVPVLQQGALSLDPSTRDVRLGERPIHVSAKEFAVLEALLRRPGILLSRAQLEESVYGWGEEIASNSIEVYIHGLRRKLGPEWIESVRGAGYRIAKQP